MTLPVVQRSRIRIRSGRPKEYDGKPVFLNDEEVIRIAQEHNTTPGQVALSWGVQRGTVVIPKSENPERIKQNITVSLSLLSSRAGWLTFNDGVSARQVVRRGDGYAGYAPQEARHASLVVALPFVFE